MILAELENPQGISTIHPPPLKMSSIMYSPNCGLALISDDGIGAKIERYYSKAISYATMASVLAIIQIFVLIHQMEYTPTPSVSFTEKKKDQANRYKNIQKERERKEYTLEKF